LHFFNPFISIVIYKQLMINAVVPLHSVTFIYPLNTHKVRSIKSYPYPSLQSQLSHLLLYKVDPALHYWQTV